LSGRLKQALKREEGQALVEFALVLPILLVLVLGIVDFGRAINYWNGETSLANDVARIVSIGNYPTQGPCTGSESTLTAFATCALTKQYGISTSSGSSLSSLVVCVSVPSNAAGQPVTVKITGSYKWLPVFKFVSPAKLSGSATIPLINTVSSSIAGTQTTVCS
jgi:Flp pilus assembly protein TadG